MMKQELGDSAVAATKRRRKHSDITASAVGKPDSPDRLRDPFLEQLHQNSAARILQELPRYNWLEQKILQRTAYNQSPGSANSNSPQSQSSRGTNNRSPGSPDNNSSSRPKLASALEGVLMTRNSTVAKQSHDGDGGKGERLKPSPAENILQKDDLSSKQNVEEFLSTTTRKTEGVVSTCMKLNTKQDAEIATAPAPTLKLEVSAVENDDYVEGYEINIPSPDDGNDEHNLTIDLTGIDDTELSSSEFADPATTSELVDSECDDSGAMDTDAHESWLDQNKNSPAGNQQTKGALNLPPSLTSSAGATSSSLTGSGVLSSVRQNAFRKTEEQTLSGSKADTGPPQGVLPLQSQLCNSVTAIVSTTTQSTVTVSKTSFRQEVVLLTSSSTSQGGDSETLPGISSDNSNCVTSDSVVEDKHGVDSNYCGLVGLLSLGTKTTTTVTATAASASSVTTTTTSSKLTGALESETVAPLDLCLKKSESLTTSSSRTKGNPPVQMVLPQVQHKLATTSSQSGFTPGSQVTVEVKPGGKSATHGLELSEDLDLTQPGLSTTSVSKPHHITSKPALGSDFKVERCYPLHSDTLDLCIKSSSLAKSSAADPLIDETLHQRHHLNNEPSQSSEMEESISIGLALSAELETERERDINSRLIINESDSLVDAFMDSNSSDTSANLASELLDIPISLSSSSYQTAKSMTDAELDQEFQKHLIEFKALEKLAERKAQEQMQVAIMRKRKAEMLRVMEMKKAKRDLDRVGQVSSKSRDTEKLTALKSNALMLKTFSPTPASSTVTSFSLTSPVSSKTFSSSPAVLDLGNPTPSCPNYTPKLPTVMISKYDQAFPCPQLSCDTKAIDTVGTKLQTSMPLTPTEIKKETSDSIENDSVVDLRFPDPHIPNKECKTEIVDSECKSGSESHSANAALKSDNAVESSGDIFEEKNTFRDNQNLDRQTAKSVPEQNSDPSVSTQKAQTGKEPLPVPAPAHQIRPTSLPLDKSDCSQPYKVYIQGPYYRRHVAINEPPFLGKEGPKDEVLRKAHMQRPFQTSGSERKMIHGSSRPPGNDPGSLVSRPRSGTYTGSRANERVIHPRQVGEGVAYRDMKSSERPTSLSGESESHKKMSSDSAMVESMHVRSQRKSLDESELNRSAGPSVSATGPRSADDVNKGQQLFQSQSPISNRMFFSRTNGPPGTPPHLDKQVLSQRQQHQMQLQHAVPPVLTLQAPNGISNYLSEEEEKRFRTHNIPQINQIMDLTCDNVPSKGKTVSSPFPSQSAYMQHLSAAETTPGSDDPSQYSRLDPSIRPSLMSNSQKALGGPDLMPAFFHSIRSDRDTSSLPNGFINDRSRPGGFITNKLRTQNKEPVQPVPIKDPGFFKEHIRPSMSSVTQHRQRYKGNPLDPHLPLLAQAGLSTSYHKPTDDLALRFQGHPGSIVWSDEQPTAGVEFFAANPSVQWRGPSPITSTHSGPGKEMYTDVNSMGSRCLADDMEKQRRSEIHPAFHSPSDLVYKQQNQLEMDLVIGHSISGMGSAFSSASALPISSLHSNSTSLRQQPMIGQNYPQRTSLMSSQPQSHNTFVRHQVPQEHFQSQQQQQQQSPLCQLQPVEMTPGSWRSYGNADLHNMSAPNSQSRPSHSQNQQLSSGQSVPSMHHDSIAYQKMQQHQQYQMHQMQQGRPTHKLMVAPSGNSPVQSMSLVQSSHSASGLAPPQLLFGDCSRLPTYSNISPTTAVQTSTLMMPQSRTFHHPKVSEAEHMSMMHQRQQSKLSVYDQRPRMPQQSQAMSGIPAPTAPLSSPAGPSRPGGAGAFGPLGPAPGGNMGPTNSVCRVCGKVAVFLCSSCRRVWYCNQLCQTKHWSVHASECKPIS